MRFLTSAQIKDLESKVISEIDSSLDLIDKAANACVRELMPFGAICVFCGKGNNGADGYRIAWLLKSLGKTVRVYSVFPPKSPECKRMAQECESCDIEIIPFEKLQGPLDCEVIVDAVFGIGISGTVSGPGAEAIEYINRQKAFVLSVDIPSGLDADSGIPCGGAVRADKTVTFTAPKLGMVSNESVEYCSDILVRQVGIESQCKTSHSQPELLCLEAAASLLPRRPRLSNKGTFGKLIMLAGSRGMMGAAAMAAEAAQRSGCGLVYMVCEKGMENVINIMVPQAVVLPISGYNAAGLKELEAALKGASALLIGCGSGKTMGTDFIKAALELSPAPAVIDADGLNALAGRTDILKDKNLVITPHPLEFSRLTGKTVAEIEADRIEAASAFAAMHGITVLLKGARTVISAKDGESWISLAATSALAKGGSGDVLSGIIAALCAQGLSPFDAARLGAFIHGRSGQICAEKCGEYSTTVKDIIENIKFSFMEVSSL